MDKDWGITDCTSFEVMQMFNIRKAFTGDKHFAQAGYSLIVK
jgi:predicted nucleic acid-binding protein